MKLCGVRLCRVRVPDDSMFCLCEAHMLEMSERTLALFQRLEAVARSSSHPAIKAHVEYEASCAAAVVSWLHGHISDKMAEKWIEAAYERLERAAPHYVEIPTEAVVDGFEPFKPLHMS